MSDHGLTYVGNAKTVLFRLLNQMYDAYLDPNEHDVIFDRLLPAGGARVSLLPYSHSAQRGRITVDYRRLSLTSFFYGHQLTTPLDDDLTIERVVNEVENRYGVTLDLNEVAVVLPELTGVPFPQPIVFYAKRDSVLWEGQLTVWAVPTGLLNTNPEWLYQVIPPQGLQQKTHAYLYSNQYKINRLVNTVADDLAEVDKIVTFDPLIRRVIAALRMETNDPWVVSPVPGAFNLYNAEVGDINGTTTIALGGYCTNMLGQLVFVDYPDKVPFSQAQLDAQDSLTLDP